MIIIKLMGGLGNQMFQYALGRRLAYKWQTYLRLDLAWFETQTLRSYQLGKFKISARIALPNDVENLKRTKKTGLRGWFYQAIQRRLPYYRRSVVVEQSPLFDARIVKYVSPNAYLRGYWQSEKYFASIALLLHEELKLNEPFSPDYMTWAEKIGRGWSVSLHVRRGDFVDNLHTNDVHGVCSPAYYANAINNIRRRFPESTLFIFSDDMNWARQNLAGYSRVEFVEINNLNQDQEELSLMSLCHHHIVANSSYSWWGAWLGTSPEKVVIAPRKWFNDKTRNTMDLIPESWVKL